MPDPPIELFNSWQRKRSCGLTAVGPLGVGVLVSGRGSNLQAVLDACQEGKARATVTVVMSDRPQVLALERARQAGVPVFYLDPSNYPDRLSYDLALAGKLFEYGVELVVLAGYLRLLTVEFLRLFPWRVVNIHPALLPAFPGLQAQRQAWEYGVKFSGCTVHLVDNDLDSGPVIAQTVVQVEEDDTPESLAERILVEEHRLYPRVVAWMAAGRVRLAGRRASILK